MSHRDIFIKIGTHFKNKNILLEYNTTSRYIVIEIAGTHLKNLKLTRPLIIQNINFFIYN